MAMLTGKMQTHAARIYAVSHTGRLSDVTSQTTCHSGDEQALKVPHAMYAAALARHRVTQLLQLYASYFAAMLCGKHWYFDVTFLLS